MTIAAEFLESVFQNKPPELYILIWTSKGVRPSVTNESNWFTTSEKAASFAEDKIDRNVYFELALSPKDYGPYRRCKASDSAGIPGFWIDLDIADGIHKKPNLPATLEDALKLLAKFPLQPTYIIHSGGGLQAYWLFNDLWIFNNPEDQNYAQELAYRFNQFFIRAAQPYGWDVDSVHDFARVMRLPGTWNCKADVKRPCQILAQYPVRYEPGQFEIILAEHGVVDALPVVSAARALPAQIGGSLNPMASYNPDLFDALSDLEPKFLRAWNHKNTKQIDQSCSAYDLSLAYYTLQAGWPEQEVINLLIHHQRKYGSMKTNPQGILRLDYFEKTLARARQTFEQSAKIEQIQAEQIKEDRPGSDDSTGPDDLISLSNDLGVKILGISRVLTEPPYFRLDLEHCKIKLGDASAILNLKTFENRVATAALVVIPAFTKARWRGITQKMFKIVADEAPDPIETPTGFIRYYLKLYLDNYDYVPHDSEDAATGLPFTWGAGKYVILAHFQDWLRKQQLGTNGLHSESLKLIGCKQETRHVNNGRGGTTTKSAWLLPKEI